MEQNLIIIVLTKNHRVEMVENLIGAVEAELVQAMILL